MNRPFQPAAGMPVAIFRSTQRSSVEHPRDWAIVNRRMPDRAKAGRRKASMAQNTGHKPV